MIGLIITGHGDLASGLTNSLKLIAGESKNYVAVGFPESYSVSDLECELTKALDELKDCEGVPALPDLDGGFPFRTAVMIGYPRDNAEAVAGTNLPVLIKVNMGRQFVEELGMLTEVTMNTEEGQVARCKFKPIQREELTDEI